MTWTHTLWSNVNRGMNRVGFKPDWFIIPLAALIGTLAGLVATGFEKLVEGSGHFFYDTLGGRTFPGSDWLLVLFLPALGGLSVGLINTVLKRSRTEHGVPDVVEAMTRRDRTLPASSGLTKAVTASLTMGSGGSAGVEGPIIMIGSVVGSTLNRALGLGRAHRHTLIGCGAASGMAAIFNAPIAGVLFVLEVILRDFSIKTFVPIVIASVFGTAVAQGLQGDHAVFNVAHQGMLQYDFVLAEIIPYALLGLACGGLGVTFAKAMRMSERLWDKFPAPAWARAALGGLALGVLGAAMLPWFSATHVQFGRPVFYGNGYPVIEWLLNPAAYLAASDDPASPAVLATVGLVLAAVVMKLVATCLTLGSGGSGGIIAPSLFMGAALGAALAIGLKHLGYFPGATPATYALAGMAGMIAAVAHCPLTAFLLVFEITQDYRVIVPMMLVAILATTASQFFHRDSIYQAWLRQRGIHTGSHADTMMLRRLCVEDVTLSPAVIVHPEEPAQRLIELAEQYAVVDYVVCNDQDQYLGMVIGEDVRTTLVQREAIPLMIVGELIRTGLPTCDPHETLDRVLDKFSQHDVSSLVVVDARQTPTGTITRSRLMRRYQRLLSE